jgi:hypothetical protein
MWASLFAPKVGLAGLAQASQSRLDRLAATTTEAAEKVRRGAQRRLGLLQYGSSETAERLHWDVLRQLALLQWGPPPSPKARWWPSLDRDLDVRLLETLKRLERRTARLAASPDDAASTDAIDRLVEQLGALAKLCEAAVQAWLLDGRDAVARAFRAQEGVNCSDARGGAAIARGTPCYSAIERNAHLFAWRLAEFAANALLPAVSSTLEPRTKNAVLGRLLGYAQETLKVDPPWKLLWLRERGSNTYRLAPPGETFENASKYDAKGEELVLGLTPPGVRAALWDGRGRRALDDYLTLQTRALSNVGGRTEEALGVTTATLAAEHAAVSRTLSGSQPEALRQREFALLAAPLTGDKLQATETCQKASELTPEDERRLRLEIYRCIKGLSATLGPQAGRTPLAENFFRKTGNDLAETLETTLKELFTQAQEKVSSQARGRGLTRRVRLDLEGEGQLDLDDPHAGNLVRYMLCKSAVPNASQVSLVAEYLDNTGDSVAKVKVPV